MIPKFSAFVLLAIPAALPLLPAQEILKNPGTEWQFLLFKNALGNPIDPNNFDADFHTTWQDPVRLGYDGPAFLTGIGYFGYGVIDGATITTNIWNPDGSLATEVPPSDLRYTVYFRTTVTPAQPVSNLRFTGIIDDGCIIYVNGTELTRINMDPLVEDTWLQFSEAGGDEDDPVTVFAPIDLPAGVPAVIGVSMHSTSATSSDMGFDFLIESAVGVAPGNDDFADAIELSGPLPITASGDTGDTVGGLGATREVGEPVHAGGAGGGSVWWKWAPDAAGRVFISTDGSGFDTLLAVYTGPSVGALNLVSRYANLNVPASSADEPFHPGSRVEFEAASGATYYIAVDGASGDFGAVSLEIESTVTFLDPVAELLPARSDWEYLLAIDANNQPVDPDLSDPDFDSTWHTSSLYDGVPFSGPAPALLGYGGAINADSIVTDIWGGLDHDGDLVDDTQPPEGLRYTTYFRTTFTPVEAVQNLGFEGLIDDGAIIYLNGIEVARMNVGEAKDADDWQTLADGTAINGVNDEDAPQVSFDLDRNLPAGVPVEIAVSLHNATVNSSDMGFDLRVYSVNPPPPPPISTGFNAIVTKTGVPGQFLISWASEVGLNYQVEWSEDLISWFPFASDIPGDPSGVTSLLDELPPPGTGFYRVVVL